MPRTAAPVPATGGTSPGDQRFAGLDGLRALAIAVVVVHNYAFKDDGRLTSLRAGYIGVTLFFALSGFLITALLVAEFDEAGRLRIGAFYVRRAYRLLPALAVTLALLLLTGWHTRQPWRAQFVHTGAVLGYVFNWWHGAHPITEGWGPLWSLSVEEQFYIVWPVLLWGVLALSGWRRRGRRAAPTATMVIIAAAACFAGWRTWRWWHGASQDRLYSGTDMRVDALLLGAALGVMVVARPSLLGAARRLGTWLMPALVAFLAVAVLGSAVNPGRSPGWTFGPGMTAVGVLSTAIVALAVAAPRDLLAARLLDSRVATWVGRRSYAIYLLHMPVKEGLDAVVHSGGSARAAAALVLTLVAAAWSGRFVERPALARVPRWARRRTGVTPAPAR